MPLKLRPRTREKSDLMTILLAHCKKPSFCVYPADIKAKLRSDLVAPSRSLIQALCGQFKNLVLVQSDVEKCLRDLHQERSNDPSTGWSIPSTEIDSWSKATATRVRSMLRAVQQARVRDSGAQWLKNLALPPLQPGGGDHDKEIVPMKKKKKAMKKAKEAARIAVEADMAPSSAKATKTKKSLIKSKKKLKKLVAQKKEKMKKDKEEAEGKTWPKKALDKGKRSAVRVKKAAWNYHMSSNGQIYRISSVDKEVEFAKEVKTKGEINPTAVFENGDEHIMADITCAMYLAKAHPTRARKKNKKNNAEAGNAEVGGDGTSSRADLYAETNDAGAHITVRWRKDRNPFPHILSIFRRRPGEPRKKQVCSIIPAKYVVGDLAKITDHVCEELMTDLAKEFMAGLDVTELYNTRQLQEQTCFDIIRVLLLNHKILKS